MARKEKDPYQMTFEGMTVRAKSELERREEWQRERQAVIDSIPDTPIICPFCFSQAFLKAMRQLNDRNEVLEILHCVNPLCKKGMKIETAMSTKDPESFASMVTKYKTFWILVDHDKWMHDFKERFDKDFQSKFWLKYREIKPKREEEQVEDQWKAYQKSQGMNE
ncbi:MAG: hypothetical protein JRN67_05235 [Nitrososphaerota archaeon]|nr:hypothetical protein [Nitrososphaerota archaeon]